MVCAVICARRAIDWLLANPMAASGEASAESAVRAQTSHCKFHANEHRRKLIAATKLTARDFSPRASRLNFIPSHVGRCFNFC
jgi:hypothetical protein